ncbi:hypothetical protein ABZ746_05210 [Streptomyces sp. NPDC020096]
MATHWGLFGGFSARYAESRYAESIPRHVDAPLSEVPIYEALAQGWVRAGRGVPGQHDREWAALAEQPPWPSGIRRRALVPLVGRRNYAVWPRL